ncbi:MAG: isoprenylcysteine carboxylmethyltransferase family protein [Rubrobacteraceae bacterium]
MLRPATLGAVLVGGQRLMELALSRRNERRLRDRGAVERGREHYPLMVALHALWLLCTAVEGSRRPTTKLRKPALAAFLLAQPVRYWAIASLGDYWNTKILVVPGENLVRKGPYRYISHPNYLVVVTEILALPLIFGAWVTALVFSALNAVLLHVRIGEEERALRELAEPPNDG